MPLILAIEPDRRQSAKLTMIARNQIHADLVIADSVAEALEMLDEQLPDLVLTSALVPSKDGATLSERLRALDAEGHHVQTFTIPSLAVPGQRARIQQQRNQATRGRARNVPAPPPQVGCDPVVFGMQVLSLLDRAAAERPAGDRGRAEAPRITRAVASVSTVTAEPAAPEDQLEQDSEEWLHEVVTEIQLESDPTAVAEMGSELDAMDVTEIRLTTFAKATAVEKPVAADCSDMAWKSDRSGSASEETRREPDWSDVLLAMRQDIEHAKTDCEVPVAVATDLALEEAPSVAVASADVAPHPAAAPAPSEVAAERATTSEAAAPPKKVPGKRRRPKSVGQDEFGFFDPEQCGLSVLIAKVNEITGNKRTSPKKPA